MCPHIHNTDTSHAHNTDNANSHSNSAEKTVDVNDHQSDSEHNFHIRNMTNFSSQEKGDGRTDLCMPV